LTPTVRLSSISEPVTLALYHDNPEIVEMIRHTQDEERSHLEALKNLLF